MVNECYPLIIIADEIIRSMDYPDPPKEPKAPESFGEQIPEKFDNLKSNCTVLLFSILGSSFLIFYLHYELSILAILGLCGLGLLGFFSLVFIFNSLRGPWTYDRRMAVYNEKKLQYDKIYGEYQVLLSEYKDKKKEYDKLVSTLITNEAREHYKETKRQEFLQSIKPKDRFKWIYNENGPKNPKLGRAEYFFRDYILRIKSTNPELNDFDFIFDSSIEMGDGVKYKISHYWPDILVLTSRGLLIDVEIDEPYVYDTKEPIHCIHPSGKSDFSRNMLFRDLNCTVIRFAERQILKHPDVCLKIIVEFENYGYLNKERIPTDFFELAWSEVDAIKMAEENYRDTY